MVKKVIGFMKKYQGEIYPLPLTPAFK